MSTIAAPKTIIILRKAILRSEWGFNKLQAQVVPAEMTEDEFTEAVNVLEREHKLLRLRPVPLIRSHNRLMVNPEVKESIKKDLQ